MPLKTADRVRHSSCIPLTKNTGKIPSTSLARSSSLPSLSIFVSLYILVVKTQFCPSILLCLHCFQNCSSEISCHDLNVSMICFWECCLFVISLKGLEENISNNIEKSEWVILQKEWLFLKGNNFQEFVLRRMIVISVIACDSNSKLITAYPFASYSAWKQQ